MQTAIHLGEQKKQIAELRQKLADDKAKFRAIQAEMDMIDRQAADEADATILQIKRLHNEEVNQKRHEFKEKEQSDLQRF